MTKDVTASAITIRNPVLPGFHPDPSILRVGDDYYLATSTFEWYPAVRLHHSRDLVNWHCLGGVIQQRRVLDLAGANDSCGIWAPDLTYADGRFYLIYTDVASFASGYWDPQNYVVTAERVEGPWSDPIRLHAHGFDPALYHDEDGASYMLSMSADWRPGRNRFAGIEMQRFDRASGRLLGPPRIIFTGTEAGVTEGPHLYRKDGWYYLLTAEGGTSYDHQATVARSRSIEGPYESDPAGPLLTSRHRPDLALQKAGHGSLVVTQTGEWYLAHLVGRPYTTRGKCVLGRETAIQPVSWVNGWPRVKGAIPADEVPAPDLPAHPWPPEDGLDLRQWSTLRRPSSPDWLTPIERGGGVRIHGGQSPVGKQRPSLFARRVTSRRCTLEATLDFEPLTFRHLAGVTAYYNTRNWYYLYVTVDDEGRRVLEVLSSDSGARRLHPETRVDVTGVARIGLAVTFDGPVVRFSYRTGAHWQALPIELDATILSDEHAARIIDGEPEAWGFTGAFVGLWVQDLGADGVHADFDLIRYRED